MRIDVTFAQTDMELQPAFDTIIPMDISSASVSALLDGTIAGDYASDKVKKLKYAAFFGCGKLTSVSLPNCVSISGDGYTFANCDEVETILLPKLTTIDRALRIFWGMRKVKEISLPNLTTAPNMELTFSECRSVKRINLPKLGGTTLKRYVFDNCHVLRTIILGGDTINTLETTNAFQNTGKNTGVSFRVYVPDHLVDAYKTATNWTAFASKIRPISELEEQK